MKWEDWKYAFFTSLAALVVLWFRDRNTDQESRTVTPHKKDYSSGAGLFGKHHGVYTWGEDEE